MASIWQKDYCSYVMMSPSSSARGIMKMSLRTKPGEPGSGSSSLNHSRSVNSARPYAGYWTQKLNDNKCPGEPHYREVRGRYRPPARRLSLSLPYSVIKRERLLCPDLYFLEILVSRVQNQVALPWDDSGGNCRFGSWHMTRR
mgnify:CR=1 FL=1